jgi:nucleoside-diphosphate-sugar epimerase
MRRASLGQDVRIVVPSGVYGGAPVVGRALVPTSYTGSLLMGLRGELDEYVATRHMWVHVEDVAQVALLALERGHIGERYLALGRAEDAMSLAALCNRTNEIAGVAHRVRDVTTAEVSEYGSIAWMATRPTAEPILDCTRTTETLGWAPTPLDEGLRATVDWLRACGRI